MKNSIKSIIIIITMIVMLIFAYLLGTTRTETLIEVVAMTELREIVPEGYIPLEECIPLEDIACYFIDGYDYPCFELKDVGNQLDDPENKSYTEIMESMVNETDDFRENFVDMRKVIDFEENENGLLLYFNDGTGNYWER